MSCRVTCTTGGLQLPSPGLVGGPWGCVRCSGPVPLCAGALGPLPAGEAASCPGASGRAERASDGASGKESATRRPRRPHLGSAERGRAPRRAGAWLQRVWAAPRGCQMGRTPSQRLRRRQEAAAPGRDWPGAPPRGRDGARPSPAPARSLTVARAVPGALGSLCSQTVPLSPWPAPPPPRQFLALWLGFLFGGRMKGPYPAVCSQRSLLAELRGHRRCPGFNLGWSQARHVPHPPA